MSQLLSYRSAEDLSVRWDDTWPARPSYSKTDRFFMDNCPFCDRTLDSRTLETWGLHARTLAWCAYCGWWRLKRTRVLGPDVCEIDATVGVAKRYDVSDPEVPIQELRRFLRRNPLHAAHTHPTAFERLVCDCLASAFPGSEIVHVGGVADGGIDAYMLIHDREYLVQVKRRSDLDSVESVKVVRELNGVLFREGKARGIVVSTAGRFSSSARTEANISTPLSETYEMRLLAFGDFVSMLQLPGRHEPEPWRAHPNSIGWAPLLAPHDYVPPHYVRTILDSDCE